MGETRKASRKDSAPQPHHNPSTGIAWIVDKSLPPVHRRYDYHPILGHRLRTHGQHKTIPDGDTAGPNPPGSIKLFSS
ncbi:MAG: hypothetical protein CMN05_01810 [Roseibacillus sp.]|nr:hypothetical protein [Roseibacillus sp.]MBP35021.1 hypothetical protein [Roseibacillus sp.]